MNIMCGRVGRDGMGCLSVELRGLYVDEDNYFDKNHVVHWHDVRCNDDVVFLKLYIHNKEVTPWHECDIIY